MINTPNTTNLFNQFVNIKKHPNAAIPQVEGGNDVLASIQIGNNIDDKNGHALTKTVAGIAITGGIIGVIFARNGSSKFYKQINSFIQKLDDKIYEYSKKSQSLTAIQNCWLKFNKGLKKVFEWIGATNNITAAKDAGFKALCDKIGLTKVMDWVTSQFKKITVATSRRAYENARNVADRNIAELRKIVDDIEDKESQEILRRYLNTLEKQISQITTATNRQGRLQAIEQDTADVGDKVAKELLEIIRAPRQKGEKLRLYRTEVHAAAGKEKLIKELKEARRSFTFNIGDKTKILNDACDTIGQAIKTEDQASKDMLREIRKLIKEYANASGVTEKEDRNLIIDKLTPKINELEARLKSSNYSNETKTLFKDNFTELLEIVDKKNNKKGTIEEILIKLNALGVKTNNPKAFAYAKLLTNQIRNVTNKAFDSELKLYDKFAEYSVGSAPTDVVGMLLPVALGGYAVSKGEDKDEKISATLKAGIPIIGGVATTFIAAAKMMTNMQGLLIGAVTGIGLNAIGSKADETYKRYQENSLYAQKAIAAYRKNNPKSDAV